ncbi:MAG TPA: DNA polymerase III subunit delta' C-terminal domain-containing protein [Anaerolineaceae bacterium]|nr:DNA polymerase III subunit delta' C-terminal domain-containing protein [Anaerolineaceae bacterium]
MTGMDWKVFGHEWAAEILAVHAAQDTLRHAYLFTGPPGIGRRTLALRFAQAINCLTPTAPGLPCRACRTCRQIESQQFPDLSILKAEGGSREIKIDQVRTLQRTLMLAPYAARYRVGLLLDFQNANESAQNAMLKTLEEAPTRVILLATTDAQENLLPTILSRCEIMRLRPLPLDRAAAALMDEAHIEAAEARRLAHLSGGRVGYALQLHANPKQLDKRQALLEQALSLVQANRRTRFAYVEVLTKDKEGPREAVRQALEVWISLWRDVMLCASGAQTPLVNVDSEAALRALARQVEVSQARALAARLTLALDQLDGNVNPRLLAETLLLDWP